MSAKSSIQWTDATWNPVTGCTKVSPGCDHCYAETFAERFRGVPGHPFEQGFDLTLRPERLSEPLRWRKPRRVFVNSMSDLFHRDVPDEFIERVFDVMHIASAHTFQVLTKRPERMRRFVERYYDGREPWDNVWLGVSIESDEYAWRADMLWQTRAAVRFVSAEPLLGPITYAGLFDDLDWLIVGGESGPSHRPMKLAWARRLRDLAAACRVPFFFKQVGAFRPTDDMIPGDLCIRQYPLSTPSERE